MGAASLAQTDARNTAPAVANSAISTPMSGRVLLVDDDDSLTSTLELGLSQRGYRVVTAPRAEVALQQSDRSKELLRRIKYVLDAHRGGGNRQPLGD